MWLESGWPDGRDGKLADPYRVGETWAKFPAYSFSSMAHAGYTPMLDALDPAEKAFLARLAPIDWIATRTELVTRFGARRYRDTWDAVAAPTTTNALSDDPLEFFAQCFPDTMDLPPEYWFAEYFPHDDARANHAAIEKQITARLGEPSRNDTSNCLVRVWRTGVFRVEVHTFPPDMQTFAMTNVLHAKEPRLAIASSVSISSDYALVYPDASLASVATTAVLELAKSQVAGHSRRHTRRNPDVLARAIHGAIAWQDADRVGVSTSATSLVVDRPPSIVLERQLPGRGPSSSAITVGQACVLRGDDEHALDAVAKRLALFWALPMEIQTTTND